MMNNNNSTTDREVRRFIRQSMVGRVATLSRSGRPSITPLYFSYMNGHIWLSTANWTLAAREASTDPRVSVLLQHELNHTDNRILRITGTATVHIDAATIRSSNRQLAFKYILTPAGLFHRITHRRLYQLVARYRGQSAAKGQPCVIDVTPSQIEFLDDTQPR
jgi:general stress protein 26